MEVERAVRKLEKWESRWSMWYTGRDGEGGVIHSG